MGEIRFEYQPLEVHQPFHRCNKKYACMFGAVGSGKTYALMSECIAMCLQQPGLHALVGRLYASDLRDSTEVVFFDILPNELLQAGKVTRLGGHVASFEFPNGSKVLFRGLQDWQKLKSANLGWIGIDEATELSEDTIHGLATRLRQTIPLAAAKRAGYTAPITQRYMRLATNPAGKDWAYDMFVNPEKRIVDSAWFKSTAFQNPYLPADFLADLMTKPERWVRRYVLCEFDDFGGLIYPEWSWETHVIPVRREPWDPSTVFYMGADPGMSQSNPFGAIWVALEREKRRLVVIDEYLEEGRSIRDHAKAWRKIEAELRLPRVHWRTADPTIDTREMSTGMTRAAMFRREGFSFELGPKDHGIRVPALGELVSTYAIVAQENCPQFHDQMTRYRWIDLTPTQKSRGETVQEKVRKGNDHLVDCGQYVASKYRAPLKPGAVRRELTPQEETSEEIRMAIRDQLRNRNRLEPAKTGVIL